MKLSDAPPEVIRAILRQYPDESIEEVIQSKYPTYVFPVYMPELNYFDPHVWFASEEINLKPSLINHNILLGKYKTRVVFMVV